jgi:inhibitor of cysteine peptidase
MNRAIRKRFVTIAFMALAIGSGCAAEPPAVSDFSDPAKPISVSAGAQFTLSLEANHTTGYSWQLVDAGDAKVVSFVETKYVPKNANGAVGVGGTDVFTFKAVGNGKAIIHLKYVRPWEKDKAPARTADFDVTIG